MSLFDFSGAEIKKLVIHHVGNKTQDEGIILSDSLYQLEDLEIQELILKYFLSPFKNTSTLYKFHHETDINLNEVYVFLSSAFLKQESFYQESVNISKHLYEKSSHPQIKSGELYLVYLKDCVIEGQMTDAIGIFKSENKDIYLKVNQTDRDFSLSSEKGINIKKLDKGCLIFNLDSQNGYRVAIVDHTNKSEEAVYWKDEFLKLIELKDNNYHTSSYMNLCQNYCTDIYSTLHQADKKEQAVFLNKTLNYFKNNPEFNFDQFTNEVIDTPEQIVSFTNYQQDYFTANNLDLNPTFEISGNSVKRMKRKFKNLIKLDTDVEIKIKNSALEEENIHYIERGYDQEKRMYFYKIFFNEEN